MAYTRAAGVTGAIRRALAGASMAEGIGFCSCRSDDRPRPFETAEANRAAYSELSPLSLNVLLRYIIVCSLSDTCKSVAKAHNITTVQLRSLPLGLTGVATTSTEQSAPRYAWMNHGTNTMHHPASFDPRRTPVLPALQSLRRPTSRTTVREPAAGTTRSRKAIPAIPSSKSFLSAERTFSS